MNGRGGLFNKSGCYVVSSREQKRRQGVLDDPVSGVVDEILYQAIFARASDIHVHLQPQGLIVKLRIDGVLQFFQEVMAEQALQVFARFKILANLDVSDSRMPQDGKCSALIHLGNEERLVDLRFATLPSLHGEKLLIRILDAAQHFLALNRLGLSSEYEQILSRLMHLPYGFLLTTGPTGSGKTTTLYALMTTINVDDRQIVTLEDPVEYTVEGIVQAQVNAKIGFTFDQGLRALLRQDPDVILIGEIRDRIAAQTALEAALTGHLVLSTLHTRDAISSIIRLREMGIDSYLLSAALTAIVGQRIVRRLCTTCKVADFPTAQELVFFEQAGKIITTVWRPKGCDRCFNTGYYGRIGIYEICVVNDYLRDGITKQYSLQELCVLAQNYGYKPFFIDGLEKIIEGFTTLQELIRNVD